MGIYKHKIDTEIIFNINGFNKKDRKEFDLMINQCCKEIDRNNILDEGFGRNKTIVILEAQGEMIGFVTGSYQREAYIIKALFVKEKFRKKGYGEKLINEWLDAYGEKETYLDRSRQPDWFVKYFIEILLTRNLTVIKDIYSRTPYIVFHTTKTASNK